MDIIKTLSYIFHPSIVTFIGFTLIEIAEKLSLFDFIDTTLFFSLYPFVLVLVLKRVGKVSDIMVTKKEERILPIILAIIGYLLGLFLTLFLSYDRVLIILESIYIIDSVIILLITPKYKVSVHVSTATGVAVSVTLILGLKYSFLFLIPLIVGYSRIREKAHTIGQVVLGFILSAFMTLILIVVLI
ncbi:MAG: phosphatase PAP2 family protein [Sulfolobus sp.]|jgi:membrane-associated phospholipid phosphatase